MVSTSSKQFVCLGFVVVDKLEPVRIFGALLWSTRSSQPIRIFGFFVVVDRLEPVRMFEGLLWSRQARNSSYVWGLLWSQQALNSSYLWGLS